jgi:putative transposase
MLKSYKYRLSPTRGQQELINKHIGACRFIYNLALETKNYAYASHRRNISCFDLIRQITELKKECSWLKEVSICSLQQSIIDLDKAFTSFFKGNNKFPNFKKKNKKNTFRNPNGKYIYIENGKLFQPKFRDGIKIVIDRKHKGEIRSATISKTPTGKYFVSVLCETGEIIPEKKKVKESTSVGIDLGLKDFIVTSDGIKINNPRHLKNKLSRLKYLQRQESKKVKGGINRRKANFKVALWHEKIANTRKDFLHKLSNQITNDYDAICFETLNISGMVKNHRLARSISDAGWGMFVEYCKYKSEWRGKNVLQIPTFEPSTKMCNSCGSINNALTLADREWMCANCNTFHDRDVNSAINIKNYSLKNRVEVQRGKSVKLPTMVGALKQKDIKV